MSPRSNGASGEGWGPMGFSDEPEEDGEATIIKLGIDAPHREMGLPTSIEKIEMAEELPIMPLEDTER